MLENNKIVPMVRVCDFIANYVYNLGVNHIFLVSGGGMMFLSDGICKHPKLEAVSTHHEQAAAMAAVSYSKYNENIGVAYLTTGCGGTNAITGLLHAWQDNVPCLFISGQSKRKETIRNSGLSLRQFGVQEADIIAIVNSISKYSVMINDPNDIKYHLDKAVYLAKSGRPGPVWLDIPLDVQGAIINEEKLKEFHSEEIEKKYKKTPTEQEVALVKDLLNQSTRPIIIAGQGIRVSGAINQLKFFIEQFNIPYVASRLGINLLPSSHPLFIGRIGTKGDRAGNFSVQNADLVIGIGSRLSVSSTGHDYNSFAREAKIVVIDIDPIEHKKNTVRIDHFINADAKIFLESLNDFPITNNDTWVSTCQNWKAKWPVCLPEYFDNDTNGLNTYAFVDILSKHFKDDSVIISDAGSAFYVMSQGIILDKNQRYITSGGQAEMGYSLPASIGVSFSRNKGEVFAIQGDGSFQMNIQELQTLVHHNLPVKLFIWNNNGYSSIRETQEKFFDKRLIGTDKSSGVSFPELEKISFAYGIKYVKLDNYLSIKTNLNEIMNYEGPLICEVICDINQKVAPNVSSFKKEDGTMASKPLEDMWPFMEREELFSNMITTPLDI